MSTLANSKGDAGPQNGFILLLSLSGQSSYADSSRAPLYDAISKKFRVVSAYTTQEALAHLSNPELMGVIVSDGGIAKGNQVVLQKLVQYARTGGTVVAGLSFGFSVTGDQFQAFFTAFGLSWKRGSYHRQDFYLNRSNEIGRNSLLKFSYSMKAQQVEGITASMAVYQSTSPDVSASQPSSAVVLARQSQPSEAPIAITDIGAGRLGYVGDGNDERDSMNVYLAMLKILDDNTCIDTSAPQIEREPVGMSFADLFSQSTRPAREVPRSRTAAQGATSRASQPRVAASTATPAPSTVPTVPTVVIVALDGQASALEKDYKHQLDALRSKVEVSIVSRTTELSRNLASPSTLGVYIADGGILKRQNKTIYPTLVEYAERGGKIVCGGLFPASLNNKNATAFFEAFGLSWTTGGKRVGRYELLQRRELAQRNVGLLPDVYKMQPQNLAGITLEVTVYMLVENDPPGSEDDEPFDSPIVYVRIGAGSLGYIGDLKGEPQTTPILLAMFGLLQTQGPFVILPPPARQPKKFVILVSPSNISPLEVEHEYGEFIKKVEEKVEVVRGLSAERVADLMNSPDLTAVLVSASITETSPAMAYLKSKLVEFTKAGGSLIFLRTFAQDISLQASRDFFLNNWGLDWTTGIRKRVEKDVRLNESNALVNGRRKKWLPKAPQWEGALTFTSTNSADIVYVPTKWEGEGSPGFAQFDGARGRYYEGPVLYAIVGEDDKGKVGFVGGRKDAEESAKVVVTMIVSGF